MIARQKRDRILKKMIEYTEEEKRELDKLYEQDFTKNLNKKEYEQYINEVFKDTIDLYNKIEKLEERQDNQILNIVKNLESKINNTTTQTNDNNVSFSKKELEEYYDIFFKEKIEEGISENTIKQYKSTKKFLLYFLKEKGNDLSFKFFKDLQNKFKQLPLNFLIKNKNLLKYEDVIKNETKNYKKLTNKTINNHILRIGSFIQFLEYNEYIKINNCTKLKNLPEEKETNKEEFSKEDLENIFNSDFLEERDKDFCKTALYSGLRLGELYSLTKEDIDIKNKLINVNLKDTTSKKHQRIIPISSCIFNILERRIKTINKKDKVFFNDKSQNATNKHITRRINKIVIEKSKTFHSFRKNFSQMIEDTDADYKTKKYLMGHSLEKDITHTIYNRNKINIDKLRQCIDKISI